MNELRTATVKPGARECRCSGSHSPRPLVVHSHHIHPQGHGGSDDKSNLVWLCPTAHYNVHHILDYLLKYGHKPRGRFNPYQLEIATRGYESILKGRASADS